MQIPENPNNNDIRDALIQLREELRDEIEDVRKELSQDIKALSQKVDNQDYKFDAFQRGTDGMVRMAITIIIATATVVILPSLSPAIVALIEAFAQ